MTSIILAAYFPNINAFAITSFGPSRFREPRHGRSSGLS